MLQCILFKPLDPVCRDTVGQSLSQSVSWQLVEMFSCGILVEIV